MSEVSRWKGAVESKDLIVNIGKTEVLGCRYITKNGISSSKAYPCEIRSLRAKVIRFVCRVFHVDP